MAEIHIDRKERKILKELGYISVSSDSKLYSLIMKFALTIGLKTEDITTIYTNCDFGNYCIMTRSENYGKKFKWYNKPSNWCENTTYINTQHLLEFLIETT